MDDDRMQRMRDFRFPTSAEKPRSTSEDPTVLEREEQTDADIFQPSQNGQNLPDQAHRRSTQDEGNRNPRSEDISQLASSSCVHDSSVNQPERQDGTYTYLERYSPPLTDRLGSNTGTTFEQPLVPEVQSALLERLRVDLREPTVAEFVRLATRVPDLAESSMAEVLLGFLVRVLPSRSPWRRDVQKVLMYLEHNDWKIDEAAEHYQNTRHQWRRRRRSVFDIAFGRLEKRFFDRVYYYDVTCSDKKIVKPRYADFVQLYNGHLQHLELGIIDWHDCHYSSIRTPLLTAIQQYIETEHLADTVCNRAEWHGTGPTWETALRAAHRRNREKLREMISQERQALLDAHAASVSRESTREG